MSNKINDLDLMEVYRGDTIGRKYKKPIITKDTRIRTEPARELRTIDLNCRMDKTEFRRLDKDTQREYIFYLHKTYGATLIEIGEMLGYSNNSIFGVTKRLKIVGKFGNGNKKKTEAQKTAWKKFLNSGEKTIEIPPHASVPEFTVNNLSFGYTGIFCASELAETISKIIKDGMLCKVRIEIEGLGDGEK